LADAVEEASEGDLSKEIPEIVASYTFVVFELKPAWKTNCFFELDDARMGEVHFS
jgi:hypothetical protein